MPEMGEHGSTAGNLDRFLHPLDTADERVVPFLEVHARAACPASGSFTDPTKALLEPFDEPFGLRLRANDPSENADHLEAFGNAHVD